MYMHSSHFGSWIKCGKSKYYNVNAPFSLAGKAWFLKPSKKWGCARFVPLSKLKQPENGYLVNDACMVEAKVTVRKISNAL